jgi:hypothetical protein
VDDLSVLKGYLRWDSIQDVIHETYVPNPVGTPAEAEDLRKQAAEFKADFQEYRKDLDKQTRCTNHCEVASSKREAECKKPT